MKYIFRTFKNHICIWKFQRKFKTVTNVVTHKYISDPIFQYYFLTFIFYIYKATL